MYRIVYKKQLNKGTILMEIKHPDIAKKAQPGQFIILRVDEEHEERIPLTIAGTDSVKGTVKIIFQIVGATTKLLSHKEQGEYIKDFVGPLGEASRLDNLKKVLVVGGGVGCAIALPIAEKLWENGAEVTSVIGFRNKDAVILEEEFRKASERLFVMTDDGSYGEKGNVVAPIDELLKKGESFDHVFAIGPLIMMKFVVEKLRPTKIPCTVSMNPIMIDGTGMCGGCRLTVNRDGRKITKFACVDGPDFNGYEVDFDEAISRGNMYSEFEKHAFDDTCRLFSKEKKKDVAEGNEKKKSRYTPHKKVEMPTQKPEERKGNFDEVALGYTDEMAIREATACLDCKSKPCVRGCPVNVNIPEFIRNVKEGDFEKAYEVIQSAYALPAVCSRVCPQELQCESKCVCGIKGEPIAIGRLERFVADRHNSGENKKIKAPEKNGIKVAVIGSGPAGLACSGELARRGYDVTVYEALHRMGGVLVYGIPEFRLPKAIVETEVERLREMGVRFEPNTVIGRLFTIDELLEKGFKAVFIGSGAGLPNFMGIKGESLKGVYSANEFLTRINLMNAHGDKTATPVMKGGVVAVVGGGNVAMDAARTAVRLGARKVYVVYRRSMEEIPARHEEVEHALEEGVEFLTLNNPVEIIGNNNPNDPKNGFVSMLRCVRMELTEPDEKGRKRPVPVPDSEYNLQVDTVIIAIGTSPNPLIKSTTEELETNRYGGIVIHESTCETTKEGVFAGGDVVTGAATVISAMGAGKKAAEAIDEMIKEKNN